MRQLFPESGLIKIKNIVPPLMDEYSVLVAVHYSFLSSISEADIIARANKNIFTSNFGQKICKLFESILQNNASDADAIAKQKLIDKVQTLGYSCSGKVVAVGSSVKKFKEGDYVACTGAGLEHHADLVCVPEKLTVLVSKFNYLKEASLSPLGAIALQGIRRAQFQIGETVAIIGLGLIGQLMVQLANKAGCTVIGIDSSQERLSLALTLGAKHVYSPEDAEIINDINFVTQHFGVDCSFITSTIKNRYSVAQAVEITRKKGKIVIVGDVDSSIAPEAFYQKELDILLSNSYGVADYDYIYEHDANVRWTENKNMQLFVQLIESAQLNLEPLIDKIFTFDTLSEAYSLIQEKKIIGALLSYESEELEISRDYNLDLSSINYVNRPSTLTFLPIDSQNLRVGIIGAGSFAKVSILPILKSLKMVKSTAIVDTDISSAISVAKTYKIPNIFSSDKKLFESDIVDVIIIASPHKFHVDQALVALKNGKAVFLEKPLAVNYDQLDRFKSFITKHSDMPFCIDYNLSFSPFIQKIKKIITKRSSPLMIHYRINGGFIPKEHWMQTSVGAGRIIGEACHIIDLFYYLTDSEPISVSVESLKSVRNDIFPTDNFSVQLLFRDGSICSLFYTALGHNDLGKERMEVFYDSKTIILEDYLILTGYGFPKSFNQHVMFADKGHRNLLNLYFNRLNQPHFESPISLKRILDVTSLTILIDELACKGGGAKELL